MRLEPCFLFSCFLVLFCWGYLSAFHLGIVCGSIYCSGCGCLWECGGVWLVEYLYHLMAGDDDVEGGVYNG